MPQRIDRRLTLSACVIAILLILILGFGAAWAQTQWIQIDSVWPAYTGTVNPNPGQQVLVSMGWSNPFNGCQLTFANSTGTPVLKVDASGSHQQYVTLPANLEPGAYAVVCIPTSGVNSNTVTINVVLAPPTIVPAAVLPFATVPFQLTVQQPYGYLGRIHFTSDDPNADLPWDYTFTPEDAGSHSFTLTFSTSGSYTLTVADIENVPNDVASEILPVLPAPVVPPLTPTNVNPQHQAGFAPVMLTVQNDLDLGGNVVCDTQPTTIRAEWLCLGFNLGIPKQQLTLDDGSNQSVPELSIPSSSIIFPVELTATTLENYGSVQQFQGKVIGYDGVPTTQCPIFDVNNGTCQVIASGFEYDVAVEQWVPKNPIQPTTTGTYAFADISPLFGSQAGTWVPVTQQGKNFVSVTSIQTQPYPTTQFKDIFVALHQVDTYLRVGVSYRFNSPAAQLPLPAQYPDSPSDTLLSNQDCAKVSPDKPCVDWSQTIDSRNWFFGPPFLVSVIPSSVMQPAFLPYTVVYLPPGDKSLQTYSVGTSVQDASGFSLAEGNGTITGNAESTTMFLGTTAHANYMGYGFSSTGGDSSQWTVANNQTYTVSNGQTFTEFQSALVNKPLTASYASAPAADPTSPTYSYFQEYFWGDHIELLLNPKVAIWNLSSCADNTQPPCTNVTPLTARRILYSDYSYGDVMVAELYSCLAPGGSWKFSDNPESNSAAPVQVVLTPNDCYELLKLDPFFMGTTNSVHGGMSGQSTTLSALELGQSPPPPPGTRFQGVAPYLTSPFGDTGHGGTPYNLSQQMITGFSLGTSATATFTSTQTTTQSDCAPFSSTVLLTVYGQTSCRANTTGAVFQVVNGATSAVTSSQVTNVTGTLNDDRAIIYKNALDPIKAVPGAFTKLYFDGVFGTWAFQMPNAPQGPWAGSFPPPVVTSVTAQGLSAVTIKGSNLAAAVAVNFGTYTVTLSPDCGVCPWSPDGTSLNVSAPIQLGGQANTVDVTVTTPSGSSLPNANDKYTFSAVPWPPPVPRRP